MQQGNRAFVFMIQKKEHKPEDFSKTLKLFGIENMAELYKLILEKMHEIEMNKFLKLFEVIPQIILHGPPGTGKTHQAMQIAESFTDNGRIKFVQFHPSYNYEDFVRGIKAETNDKGSISYKEVNKIFAEIYKEANNNKGQKYFLIIDEINRANVATVLGELLYALEYRGKPVTTTYADSSTKDIDNKTLIVPENLYIIGTMNTSDRSIGHIDYAVRRRFAFIECLPDSNIIANYNSGTVKESAQRYFNKVSELFKKAPDSNESENAAVLSQDYRWQDVQIGHTYFLAKSQGELTTKMTYQVAPLLKEYLRDGILTDKAKVNEVITEITK